MAYKLIFLFFILSATIYAVNYLIHISEKHDNEIKRINALDKQYKQKKFIVDQARLNTTPCHIPDLLTPKNCYIDSNYDCTWSTEAERCNLIENINM